MTKGRNDWPVEEDSVRSTSVESPRRELKKKRTGCSWSDSDYNLLVSLVRQHGEDWPRISRRFQHKSAKQCMQKFKNSQRSGKKGNWSRDEDDLLVAWVHRNGSTKWTECSKYITGRCGKQCRERWVNILNPEIKKGDWSDREQELIFAKLPVFQTSWSLMAGALVGRTENSIKNYFYSSIRRLKSNPAISAIRDVYVDKTASVDSVFNYYPGLNAEVEKLNTLSRRICTYLLTSRSEKDMFGEFLLSVIFGGEGETATTSQGMSHHKPPALEVTPKKIQPFGGSSGHGYPEQRFHMSDQRLVVPQENHQSAFMAGGPFQQNANIANIIETMKRISEAKTGYGISNFVAFLETQLKDVQVVNCQSKILLRLPTCMNCQNECCQAKASGVRTF